MMRKRFRPGVSFGDFVIADVSTRKSRIGEEKENDYRKGWLLWMLVIVALGGLLIRLGALQLIYGERYRLLANQNRIKIIKLPAARGKITDRNGAELADNIKKVEEVEVAGETDVVEKWRRVYPLGNITAHVVGYLGEIQADEVGLLKTEGKKYMAGDWMGRSGLEAWFEETLRGNDGGRLVEVDHTGKIVREMGREEPVAGQDIKVTLDSRLQEKALTALEGKKGAAIVQVPATGEILALVSSPSFDSNLFNDKKNQEVSLAELLTDPELPLFNRAIGAVYPPGSTFKMITTAAAISEGKVPANFTYEDTGVIKVGDFSYSNWLFTKRGGTEGVVGFVQALKRSTDTFFYKVGEMTGAETMGKWARQLGLGQIDGVELPGEVAGLIPDPEWKMKTKNEQWFLGNTFHMAIGQGDVLATPLQINGMTAALANKGRWCKPHLLEDENSDCRETGISQEALKTIEAGMKGACETGGTAFVLFGFEPRVACKTGTAEYVAENGKTKTHGWLTAYAPADNPEIAVTVVIEGGGEGSNVAAPVVRKIMAAYFGVVDTYNYAAIPQEIGD